MVPEAEPPVCVSETEEAKLELSVETSKFAGAVTVIFAVRLIPETEKFWEAEGVPWGVEKELSVPVVVSVGTGVADGVTSTQVVAILNSSISMNGVAVVESCRTTIRLRFDKSVPVFVAESDAEGSVTPSCGLIHIFTVSLAVPDTIE